MIAISLFILSACDLFEDKDASKIRDEVVRIHIRANSNSGGDQTVKLKVRDEITEYLTLKLEGCADKSDALKILSAEQSNLTKIAESVLKGYGYDYKASVLLKTEYFEERGYDGYTFPAGEYDALIINLGSGEGDNWWCVAFPPLCFVPTVNDGEKIVYKSWVKEILDRIFRGE